MPAPRRGPYRPRDRHVHGPLFVAIIIASAVGLWHDAPPIAAVAGPAATTVVGLVLTRWRLAAVDDPIDDNSIYLRDAELHRTQSSNLCGFAQCPSIAIAKLTDVLGIDPSEDDPRRLIYRLRQWTVTIVGGGDNGRHSSVREVLARWQAAFQNRRFDFTTVRIVHRFLSVYLHWSSSLPPGRYRTAIDEAALAESNTADERSDCGASESSGGAAPFSEATSDRSQGSQLERHARPRHCHRVGVGGQ